MAGITDRPFRDIVSGFGAGLVVSEMIASQEMVQAKAGMREKAELGFDADQTAVQIAGREEYWMAEAARLAGQVEKLDGEIAKIETKLGNEKFTSRAPAQVIEEQRQRRAAAIETRDKLAAAMKRLAAL